MANHIVLCLGSPLQFWKLFINIFYTHYHSTINGTRHCAFDLDVILESSRIIAVFIKKHKVAVCVWPVHAYDIYIIWIHVCL